MNIFDFMNSHPFISLAIAYSFLMFIDNMVTNFLRRPKTPVVKRCPNGVKCNSCRAEDYPDYKPNKRGGGK